MIILCLLFVLTKDSLAQDNTIVYERMVWSNLSEICEPGGNTYFTFYHRFEGDSIVDGKTYKKVLISNDEAASIWSYTGELVREEEGRVYYRDVDGKEGLIYDFNLKPGEQVTVVNPLEPDGLTLTMVEVDSVEVIDGYRKRWKLILDEFAAPEYWIEGIGSESGVLNSGTGVFLGLCGIYYLLCASEDGIGVYIDPEYQTCYYQLLDNGNEISKDDDQVLIHYQPFNKSIIINTRSHKNSEVVLTSMNGMKISTVSFSGRSHQIDCSDLPPGFYVVSVINDSVIKSLKISIH